MIDVETCVDVDAKVDAHAPIPVGTDVRVHVCMDVDVRVEVHFPFSWCCLTNRETTLPWQVNTAAVDANTSGRAGTDIDVSALEEIPIS